MVGMTEPLSGRKVLTLVGLMAAILVGCFVFRALFPNGAPDFDLENMEFGIWVLAALGVLVFAAVEGARRLKAGKGVDASAESPDSPRARDPHDQAARRSQEED